MDVELGHPLEGCAGDVLQVLVAGDIDRLRLRPHLLHEAELVHFIVEVIAVAQAADQRHVAQRRFLRQQIHHQRVEIDNLVEG